jgi:hypothetical protein
MFVQKTNLGEILKLVPKVQFAAAYGSAVLKQVMTLNKKKINKSAYDRKPCSQCMVDRMDMPVPTWWTTYLG